MKVDASSDAASPPPVLQYIVRHLPWFRNMAMVVTDNGLDGCFHCTRLSCCTSMPPMIRVMQPIVVPLLQLLLMPSCRVGRYDHGWFGHHGCSQPK